MKKTLVSALSAALVVGTASVTFAAANPFEDVPADHWAYDAVAQLAKDGVIEGYGDGTYVGDAAITRYEMAQMVARAMAKSDLKHADKATLDKLAAEFADELNNLGVRVAKLEKKVDNVKWGGQIRYRFINRRPASHKNGATETKSHTNQILLRFLPQMQINDNWKAVARLDYGAGNNLHSGANDKSLTVDRIYVEGTYGNTKIYLGRFNYKTNIDQGMFLNERVSGAQVVFGKNVKVAATVGRYNHENYDGSGIYNWDLNGKKKVAGETSTYWGLEIFTNPANKFMFGAGIHNLKNNDLENSPADSKHALIWEVGLNYKMSKNFSINGAYARNTKGKVGVGYLNKSSQKTAWQVELNYKGSKKDKVGSYGLFAAYRHLGDSAVLYGDRDATGAIVGGQKGIEVGGQYTFFKNIQGQVRYFTGKSIAADKRQSAIFTQFDFWF